MGDQRWMNPVKVALGAASTVTAMGGVSFVGLAAGCLDRPIETVEPRTTSTYTTRLGQSGVEKIDVLLVIDNSGSMADKQLILSAAVPQLVRRLITPQCVDEEGRPDPAGAVNSDDQGICPDGYSPEFQPIADINIGIISSSIGAAGSTRLCNPVPGDPQSRPNDQDLGRLLSRTTPCQQGENAEDCPNDVTTYENLGFLAWDPAGERPCPGDEEADCPGTSDPDALIATLTSMVTGVGEFGCGFEAPLEAAYRFLADPSPWAGFDGPGSPTGEDATVLAQRAAFLRPDSLVAVILLTDENDCSLRADGIGQLAAQADLMPRPRSECAANPDDACCVSCIENAPSECAGDGGCEQPGCQDARVCPGNFHGETDPDANINIRCWDQKRRFGIDFLYPTDRYVNAFGALRIDPGAVDLAAAEDGGIENPLFADGRFQDSVFVAGIAGVPWQLLARKNAEGKEDLRTGLDADGNEVGGLQTAQELTDNGVWAKLLPDSGADQPDDPHMIESVSPRAGLTRELGQDVIHGNEWDTEGADLQYACIFDLPDEAERVCDASSSTCDCGEGALEDHDNPLCDPAEPSRQLRAKAYPGTRILQVLQGLGDQGIPASICPAQTDAPTAKDYGYTPAVFAIIDRLKLVFEGACQPIKLVADTKGNVPCLVLEAVDSDGDADPTTRDACRCDGAGRRQPEEGGAIAAGGIMDEIMADEEPFDCLCEVVQLSAEDRTRCQNDEPRPPNGVDGWCYIDATTFPPIGNPALVDDCPETEQRVVRFVGEGNVQQGGRQYITCSGEISP